MGRYYLIIDAEKDTLKNSKSLLRRLHVKEGWASLQWSEGFSACLEKNS